MDRLRDDWAQHLPRDPGTHVARIAISGDPIHGSFEAIPIVRD